MYYVHVDSEIVLLAFSKKGWLSPGYAVLPAQGATRPLLNGEETDNAQKATAQNTVT